MCSGMKGYFYGLEKQEGHPWPWRMARFETREALEAWLAHPIQRYDSETGELITMDKFKRYSHEVCPRCPLINDVVKFVQVDHNENWHPSKSRGDQDGMFLWLPVH